MAASMLMNPPGSIYLRRLGLPIPILLAVVFNLSAVRKLYLVVSYHHFSQLCVYWEGFALAKSLLRF